MAWGEAFFSSGALHDALTKAVALLLVQVLVYFILSKSSGVFSAARERSTSFRTVRSLSVRRLLAALSDLPAGGEVSPPGPARSVSREGSISEGVE